MGLAENIALIEGRDPRERVIHDPLATIKLTGVSEQPEWVDELVRERVANGWRTTPASDTLSQHSNHNETWGVGWPD